MKAKLLILFLSLSLIQVLPASSLDFSGSALSFDNSSVGSGEQVLVTVLASNSTDTNIENAVITLSISGGSFASLGQYDEFANNGQSVTGLTPANGTLVVSWVAPEVNSTVPSLTVGFTATISTPYANTLLKENVTVQTVSNDIANSELYSPDVVRPGENFTITALVKDASDNPKSDIDVSFDVSDGAPVDVQSGLSNASGMVSIEWSAPLLSVATVNVTLNIRALISASESVNITLSKQTEVIVSSQTTLQIVQPSLSSVKEKSDNVISLGLQLNGSLPAIGGEIDVQVTDGLFYRVNTTYSSVVNENGIVSFNWTAPSLPDIQPLIVNFTIEGRYVNLTIQDSFNISVMPIYGNLTIEMSIQNKVFRQDELIPIDFLVYDSDTLNPTGEVAVFVTAEFGFFESSGLNEIVAETDLRGETQVFLNLTEVHLIVEIQEVTLYANASKLKYNMDATTQDVSVKRILSPDLKMDVTVDENTVLNRGDSLDFLVVTSDLSGNKMVNITVEISADAGSFANGDQIFRASTDNNGEVTITWTSDLSISVPSLTISFHVTLVNEFYTGSGQNFHVVVIDTAAQSSSQQIDTSGANKQNNTLLAVGGSIATIAAAGAGIAIIYKKRT